MKILLFSCFLFASVNTNMITTGGINVVLLSLMPLQSAIPLFLDTLEEDVGLLPTRVYQTTSRYGTTSKIEHWDAKLERSYKECKQITGISDAYVNEFRSGIWKKGPLIQDWVLCVLNKMELMSLQGVFRYDTALEYIHRDIGWGDKEVKKASALINSCLTDKPVTAGQIAWEYLRCHRRKDGKKKYPSLGILQYKDLGSEHISKKRKARFLFDSIPFRVSLKVLMPFG